MVEIAQLCTTVGRRTRNEFEATFREREAAYVACMHEYRFSSSWREIVRHVGSTEDRKVGNGQKGALQGSEGGYQSK
eukprot:8336-Pleurochrysis_carterae.AAC.1